MPTTLAALNACDRGAFVAALGPLFEHSPWVADETFARRPFASVDALHAALCETMLSSSEERRMALIRAHPDLAGRLARAGGLTDPSTREQAAAGLDRLSGPESAEIERLNEAYQRRFGFPFIICARLNAKDTILGAMRARSASSPEDEVSTALSEIAKIARLRLNDTVSGND
jgi:2-oxo-4-hydroxy-4-carboxy-5-ureidoimidazoline decarboxylase